MNNISPQVSEIEQNVHKIRFENDQELYLIGTAHVSQNSADLVERIITEVKPDRVCLELDEQRFEGITKKNRYEDLNIFNIIKKKQLFFFIGQFVMSSFQKKISEQTGSRPGSEFIRAIDTCNEAGIDIRLIDRNIGTTLKRAWRLTPFRHKMKFLGALLFTDNDELENLDIEELKNSDAIETMVNSFSDDLPVTKEVLIDERDIYLTYGMQQNMGEKTVVVVGAGHVPGILKKINSPISDDVKNSIDFVPDPSIIGRLIPWIIPAIVICMFVWGFTSGRKDIAQDAIIFWIVANGALTSIGCILALAHPLTIIAGFIAAPITSLNPTIGAGFVTAIIQSIVVKTRISDFEQINSKSMKFRQWWSNRITKIFLVFIFSSIGSSIGTFVALPALLNFFK